MKTFSSIAPAYPLRLADAESIKKRIDSCSMCDHYDNGTCTLCGCNMKKKVVFEQAECGDGRW